VHNTLATQPTRQHYDAFFTLVFVLPLLLLLLLFGRPWETRLSRLVFGARYNVIEEYNIMYSYVVVVVVVAHNWRRCRKTTNTPTTVTAVYARRAIGVST